MEMFLFWVQGVPPPNTTLLPAELQSPVELRGVQPGTNYLVNKNERLKPDFLFPSTFSRSIEGRPLC